MKANMVPVERCIIPSVMWKDMLLRARGTGGGVVWYEAV